MEKAWSSDGLRAEDRDLLEVRQRHHVGDEADVVLLLSSYHPEISMVKPLLRWLGRRPRPRTFERSLPPFDLKVGFGLDG
ncbi:MAG: hypothetical protein QNJ67_04110 [Kiloniellales bacterium]|nr:hypothetical protein [Kiloniellales bacterium]